ncbi:MAG: hypothetical protein JNG88_05150 [Phycisphaerales bacterium]|nr:hypothetical protein [Phycisphaerales bacterium]
MRLSTATPAWTIAMIGVGVCLLIGQAAPTSQPAMSRQTTTAPADRWEADIAAFESYDRKTSPPRDAILFTGSSTIVLWPTARSFSDRVVLNRGFGGSQYSDLVRYYGRIIRPYKPRAIVLYSGDNDVAEGRTPAEIHAAFCELMRLIRADCAEVPVVVVSIKPSRARWALWPTMQQANALIAKECGRDRNATFVDIIAGLLAGDGEPRSEFFEEDQLHLNAQGYALLTQKLVPVLSAAEGKSPAR